MTRRCILQIGTEKTGTTTLQAFLAKNRDRLAERGVRYPRFPGEFNHTGLAAFAMDDARADPIRGAFGVHGPEAVPAFRARFEAQAEAELGGEGIFVFCNEHCHSRLKTEVEVQRLADLLTPHFDRIDISIYLRRQDQVALSLYSTRLKSGGTSSDILPRVGPNDPYFNYDRSLALWEDVFGRAHVHVRLFDRRQLVGGDVVADFLAAWGFGAPAGYRQVGSLNELISAEAQDYLRRINQNLEPIAGLPLDAVLGPLSSNLAKHFPGKGARPSRAEAMAFYDKFRTSNEAVRKRYFPGRDTLFEEEFGAYPEVSDRQTFGPDELALVAARLQTAHAREVRRLETEVRIRDGRLAWERGEQDNAIAALRRAVGHLPDHAEGHRTLAEYLHRAGRHSEAAAAARRAAELRPRRQEYWHFLGVSLRAAGDLQGAADAQEQSLKIDPSHEPSHKALSAIRDAMGEVGA